MIVDPEVQIPSVNKNPLPNYKKVNVISDDERSEEEILERLIQENQGNPEAVEILR